MNACARCGFNNRPGAHFCARCGAALPAAQAGGAPAKPPATPMAGYTVKVCPRCQSPAPVGEQRCRTCGYAFATPVAAARPRRSRFGLVMAVAIVIGLLAGGAALMSRDTPAPPPATEDSAAGGSAAGGSAAGGSAEADESAGLQRAIRATVQVIAPDPASPSGFSAGSGTVVDAAQGIILTNFHVIGDPRSGEAAAPNTVQIAVAPPGSSQPPQTLYLASVIQADRQLDLAVLRITARRNGSPLPDNLGLTAAPLGNSASVIIGDVITLLGYPGLGGDTITLTRGSVSGFMDGWIKTDAELNHGNSGGAAIDGAGRLIGVPSVGVSEEVSDERLPGKIGLVRPIDQARALLERAGVE